jgi:hypothetical protein
MAAARHCRPAKTRRSWLRQSYEARFSTPRAPEERGGQGESVVGDNGAGGVASAAVRSGAMAGSSELMARTLGGTKSHEI